MKNYIRIILVTIVALIGVVVIYAYSLNYYRVNFSNEDYTSFEEESYINPLEELGFQDNKSLYNLDEKETVSEIYITVLERQREGNSLNKIIKENDITGNTDLKVDIFFEDKEKISFINNGLFASESNGTLEVKGGDSKDSPQKSFKIKLAQNVGGWNGQEVINLEKNYFDTIRLRNKLSYDYLSLLNDTMSFQTEFIRLFIRDLSNGDNDSKFIDYGFYTQIENPNKTFLKNHRLDPNGYFYEAKNFKFEKNTEVITTVTNKNYSKKSFEEILSIKGSEDHENLINMINNVNNYEKDIDVIIEKNFDLENYLTWLSINILFDNYDANKENYLIYSPLNSSKWYFIPYKFDDAWNKEKDQGSWQQGITAYWDNILFKRFISKSENLIKLQNKVEEISKIVNEDTTNKIMEKYYEILMSNITKLPDINYLTKEIKDIKLEFDNFPKLTNLNKNIFYETIENPMPFNVTNINTEGENISVVWEESFSLKKRELTYDVYLSKDSTFNTIDFKIENLKETKAIFEKIPEGRYFLKVIVKDSLGNTQISYSQGENADGDKLFGVNEIVK